MGNVAFWDTDERPILLLVDQALFDVLPPSTILYSISGERRVKGVDEFDFDTRGGFLAWGFHLEHERNLDGSYT